METYVMENLLADIKRANISFRGRSGALPWQFGLANVAYPDVTAAIPDCHIESKDAAAAPVGAIHLFKTLRLPHGNLAIDFDGAGTRVLTEGDGYTAGPGLDFVSVEQMIKRGTMIYLGWTTFYGRGF